MSDIEKVSPIELSTRELAQEIRRELRFDPGVATLGDFQKPASRITLIPRRWEPTPGSEDLFYDRWGDEYCLHDDLKLEAAAMFMFHGFDSAAAIQLANLSPRTYETDVLKDVTEQYAGDAAPRVLAMVVELSQRYIRWDDKLPDYDFRRTQEP